MFCIHREKSWENRSLQCSQCQHGHRDIQGPSGPLSRHFLTWVWIFSFTQENSRFPGACDCCKSSQTAEAPGAGSASPGPFPSCFSMARGSCSSMRPCGGCHTSMDSSGSGLCPARSPEQLSAGAGQSSGCGHNPPVIPMIPGGSEHHPASPPEAAQLLFQPSARFSSRIERNHNYFPSRVLPQPGQRALPSFPAPKLPKQRQKHCPGKGLEA